MKHGPLFLVAFALSFGLAELMDAQWAADFVGSLKEVSKSYLIETIKAGQSADLKWAERWKEFADKKKRGTRDPSKHEAGSLMEFFDTVALRQFRDAPFVQPYISGLEFEDKVARRPKKQKSSNRSNRS